MEENRPTECRCRCTSAATRHYKRDLAIAAMNPRTSFNHTFRLGGRMVTPLGARAWIITLLTWILAGDALGRSIGTERYPATPFTFHAHSQAPYYKYKDYLDLDQSFPSKNFIFNQTVTCGDFTPGKFIAPTYTCADLRVNGFRLAYGYFFGWSVGQEYQRCQETYGVHEFATLCQMLLRSINKEHMGFKAVYIPKSTCSYMNETRKLLKKISETDFQWTDFKPGWGWTDTLQCMTNYKKG